MYARKGGGKWKCVVLFYYVAGQGAFACVRVHVNRSTLQLWDCICV